MLRERIGVLIAISAFALFLLFLRLFRLQVVEGEYWDQQGEQIRNKTDPIPFHRGTIFDRYGQILAEDLDVYHVEFSYRPFRRAHPIAQTAQLFSLLDDRFFPLESIAQSKESAARRICSISPAEIASLEFPSERSDARYYLARLFELSESEVRRLQQLVLAEEPSRQPIALFFAKEESDPLARLNEGLSDLNRLERELGLESRSLLSWIEAQRRAIELSVEKRAANLDQKLTARGRLRREREIRTDLESRRARLLPSASYEIAYFLSLHAEHCPGFFVKLGAERSYPHSISASVVGLVQRPSEADLRRAQEEEEELAQLSKTFDRTDEEQERFELLVERVARSSYQQEDQKGKLGLEAAFEDRLRGEWGTRLIDSDRPDILSSNFEEQSPTDGDDLVLSLDSALQEVAERALQDGYGGRRDLVGAVVIMDTTTGEILALASNPSFDASEYRFGYSNLAKDPRHPLHHRAFNPYEPPPPGSVFKLMVAAAGLEMGMLNPKDQVLCQHEYKGLRCNDASGAGHGSLNLKEAVGHSCNVYFYRLGETLGVETIAHYAKDRFGFGRSTGVELREISGTVRTDLRDPRRFAIGQTLISVTPLQVARAYAALGNGGKLLVPTLVRSIGDKELTPKVEGELGFKPEIYAILKEAMAEVVGYNGTARPRDDWDLRRLDVVGKSGTAEVSRGIPDHAWFAGFMPAQAPVLSFCVFIERVGMHGGEFAAPIAYRILSSEPVQRYLEEKK